MNITYCLPLSKPLSSFTIVGLRHVDYLRVKHNVILVDSDQLRYLRLLPNDIIVFHPLMFPFIHVIHTREFFYQVKKHKSTKGLKIGFDVADTDSISWYGRYILDEIPDLIIVPSSFAKNVYSKYAKVKIEVLPHGISSLYLKEDININVFNDLKGNRKFKLLYFLMHSVERKGADIVLESLDYIDRDILNNMILVVKHGNNSEVLKYVNEYKKKIEVYEISRRLTLGELITLYRSCDLLLLPSRGGGFELNGLEALASGLPIVYTEGLSMDDYAKGYGYGLKSYKTKCPLFFNKPFEKIHCGYGYECKSYDLAKAIMDIYCDYEKWKEKALKFRSFKAKEFLWFNICSRLEDILKSLF